MLVLACHSNLCQQLYAVMLVLACHSNLCQMLSDSTLSSLLIVVIPAFLTSKQSRLFRRIFAGAYELLDLALHSHISKSLLPSASNHSTTYTAFALLILKAGGLRFSMHPPTMLACGQIQTRLLGAYTEGSRLVRA